MKEKKIPVRKCVGCGESKPKRELLRVVSPKEGDVSLDPTGKAAGRGAYICADPACLAKARKARRLERAFDRQIPPEIYDSLERELTEAIK
ncbi:MAG: YlxR family protein [Clostridia bacterium]|nr:YlxR family protein [Clostridia bacterium]